MEPKFAGRQSGCSEPICGGRAAIGFRLSGYDAARSRNSFRRSAGIIPGRRADCSALRKVGEAGEGCRVAREAPERSAVKQHQQLQSMFLRLSYGDARGAIGFSLSITSRLSHSGSEAIGIVRGSQAIASNIARFPGLSVFQERKFGSQGLVHRFRGRFGTNARNLRGLSTMIPCSTWSLAPAAFSFGTKTIRVLA